MLKKILAPLVTHRDSKGRKFMDIVGARYDKKELSKKEAQNVNDAPGLPELVDEFIEKRRNGCLVPPEGGRVHILHNVPVQMDREWKEAIKAGGPDTPSDNYASEIGDQYPSESGAVKKMEIVLVNFGSEGGSLDRAIAWAKGYQLKKTNPRHVFAVGEHKPELHRKLGVDHMCVAATEKYPYGIHYMSGSVLWRKSERMCGMSCIVLYDRSVDWFAFISE